MYLKGCSCLLVALVCLTPGNGEQAKWLSVDSLFELGVAHSLQVAGSRIQAGIATSDLADKTAERLPEINVGLVGGYIGEPTIFKQGLSQPVHPDMPDWSQNYSIELIQPIYQGGRMKYAIRKADLQKQMAELYVQRDIAAIKLLLIGKYLDLIGLYKQEEVIGHSLAEAQTRLHDIRVMEKNGMTTGSDVLRSELQLSTYELSLKSTRNDILLLSQELDMALGLDEALILIPDHALLRCADTIGSYDRYIETAYRQYPELKIAQTSTEVAQQERMMVRANYLPKLSLKAGNIMARPITSTSPAQNLYANNWNIGFTLSYSLSSLYHNRYKMNRAQQTIRFQEVEQQRTMQTIRTEVKSAFIRHNESLERIKTLTISVEQADENYRIVLNKYQHHIAILTDLLDASTLQLEAQLQLTTARTHAVYTYYQLLRSSGEL